MKSKVVNDNVRQKTEKISVLEIKLLNGKSINATIWKERREFDSLNHVELSKHEEISEVRYPRTRCFPEEAVQPNP